MVSMTFSSALPLDGLVQAKLPPSSKSSPMAFLDLSHGRRLGSSKSAIFRDGFSILSSNVSGVSLKFRSFATVYARAATEKTIHDFTVKDIDGKDVALSKFKGKVLLIVNVASKCGLTSSNYTELSHIYEKYKTQGIFLITQDNQMVNIQDDDVL